VPQNHRANIYLSSMNHFDIVSSIILNRRSAKLADMNGKIIDKETIEKLLELANWAPTHGRTEPWRFYVYTGEGFRNFRRAHADLYWEHTPEDKRQEATRDKLTENGEKASHLLIAVMKRGENVKIPHMEEIAATAAAIENILLGATAMGIASFWSTGGMTHTRALKEHLQLGDEDTVMGLVYLGYTDAIKEGARNKPMSEKVIWSE
jgi:nitroreductase